MLLKEYDAEFHISCEKKISYEEGFEEGVKREKARADTARREADEANRKVDEANRKADEANRKVDEANRKADEANRKVDEANRKADEANRKVDEANRKADEADQKAEEEHRKVEILIRRLCSSGCAEEEIAAALDMSTAAVRECVREISKEKS